MSSRNTSLNFSHFNVGGGLDDIFQDPGQLTVWVRSAYDRSLDPRSFREFFVNNSLVTGLAKEFLITDTMAIPAGTRPAISLTRWAKLSASAGFGANHSTDSSFN